MSAVLNSDVKGPAKRLVLLAVANHANARGYCWPGIASLAGSTGLGRSTVFRTLTDLENEGLLERRTRRRPDGSRTSNVYRLNLELLHTRTRTITTAEADEMEAAFADAPPTGPGNGPGRAGRAVPAPSPGDAADLPPVDDSAGHRQGPAAGRPPSRSGTGARPVAGPHESSVEPPRNLSLDARVNTDAPPPDQDQNERASETTLPTRTGTAPPPHPAAPPLTPAAAPAPTAEPTTQVPEAPQTPATAPEPEAWALELITGLDYGRFRRPTHTRAAGMARKLTAAAANGLTERDLRRHCRASLNQATRNAVAYLDRALDPEHLPTPAPAPAPRPNAAPHAAPPTAPDTPGTMTRDQALAEIHRILTRPAPGNAPETPSTTRTAPPPNEETARRPQAA